MSGTFYLLACLECEPPLPMPFGSQAERGKWASEHTKGTGHDRWHVWQEPNEVTEHVVPGYYRDDDGTLKRQHDVHGGPHDTEETTATEGR